MKVKGERNEKIKELRKCGWNLKDISKEFNLAVSTVFEIINRKRTNKKAKEEKK